MGRLLCLLLWFLVGCPHPQAARMDALAEPDPVELDAKARLAARTCPRGVGVLYPGIGPLCDGRKAEGAALLAVATTDVAAQVAVPLANGGFTGPGTTLPAVWIQNAYVTAWVRPLLDRQMAKRMRYVPKDDLGDLALAPFNGHVLKRPAVWGGTLGALGLALTVSFLAYDLGGARVAPAGRVNWFGADLPDGLGWPLMTVAQAYTFQHVAIGEEMLFRGTIQSALSRGMGRWGGWAVASLIFGAAHIGNAAALSEEEAVRYLAVSVPTITVVGAVMGIAFLDARYSLTAPVAIHFWYDLTLSMLSTILDPSTSIVYARLGGRF